MDVAMFRRFAEPVDLSKCEELQEEAPRLEKVVLHACSLDSLAGMPSSLPLLTELNLSSNNLSDLDLSSASVSSAVAGGWGASANSYQLWAGMVRLRKLDLSSNRLRGAVFLHGGYARFSRAFPACCEPEGGYVPEE